MMADEIGNYALVVSCSSMLTPKDIISGNVRKCLIHFTFHDWSSLFTFISGSEIKIVISNENAAI